MPFAQFTATGNGSTKQFAIPFPYVKKDHIVVALNNVTVTGFTFINDTTIEFDTISSATATQETSGAPKTGVGIEITRDTPLTNALVDFVDGSTLTAGDLDTAVLQLLYGIQVDLFITFLCLLLVLFGCISRLSDRNIGVGW